MLHSHEPRLQVECLDHLPGVVSSLTSSLWHDGEGWLTEDIDPHAPVLVENVGEVLGGGVESDHGPLRPVLDHESGLHLRREGVFVDDGLIF